jgi:hypothetical protein
MMRVCSLFDVKTESEYDVSTAHLIRLKGNKWCMLVQALGRSELLTGVAQCCIEAVKNLKPTVNCITGARLRIIILRC